MRFEETRLLGAHVIDLEPIADDRGFFARSFCGREFEERGLQSVVAQCNVSFNTRKGTVRGLHFAVEPGAEAKLVRCTRGSIWDVIVDLRPDSPTYREHVGFELSAENRRALYVPIGFAHGFQTLTDDSEVFYQMSGPYVAEAHRAYRFDDPAFGIDWPLTVSALSDRDARSPYLGDGTP